MKLKKLSALILALVLALSLSTVAFAAGNGSISVKDAPAGSTYAAYQVFNSNSQTSGESTFYDYTLNSNFKDFFIGTSGYNFGTTETPKVATSAQQVLTYVSALDAAGMRALADALYAYATAHNIAAAATLNANNYTASVPYGYYMVVDTSSYAEGTTGTSISLVMLNKTEPNAEVTPKTAVPTLTKQVQEGETWGTVADATIGTNVNFKLTVAIPANQQIENYKNTYVLKIHDTLENTMAFHADSVVVKNGTATLVKGTDYTVANDNGAITITITRKDNNFKSGDTLTVTYDAELLSTAKIATSTVNAQTNAATLEYSNNPYTEATGTTVPSTVYVSTTQINIKKVNTSGDALQGAEFKLCTTNSADAAGIAFGATPATGNVYTVADSTVKASSTDTTAATTTTVTSDANGVITLNGLDAGTYYLVETKAPTGYVKLTSAITVTVTHTAADNGYTYAVSYGDNQTGTITVQNSSNLTLPSTGGNGTLLFTIAGIAVLLSAGAYLYLNRKRVFGE